MNKVITFNEAIRLSEQYNKRHLLLGNGFSIACVPDIFTYSSLFEEADFSSMPQVKNIFVQLQTRDFEKVIHALEMGSLVLPSYNSKLGRTSNKMRNHAHKLKELLIETIATNHPSHPSEISELKYIACNKFLSYFLSNDCRIYSLNYDLLLYWTVMYGMEHNLIPVEPNDGFGKDTDFEDGEFTVSDYITWQGESSAFKQNIHYLHGALHVFDQGPTVEKFTWINTGVRLIDQTRKALSSNKFPIYVAEGESQKKMEKITHSGYLYHSYKSFSSTMNVGNKKSTCCLFTYGVSFSDNDSHIVKKIADGKLNHLFVGLYGDPKSGNNKKIINEVERIKRKRRSGVLTVTYYDSSSAKVWG